MNAEDPIIFFNDRYVRLADAKISLLTHALHYGTGVFDGIRGYWCEEQNVISLFRTADHYHRWKLNCGLLRMDLAYTDAELCDITAELIRRNDFRSDVYVRPLAYRSSAKLGVRADDNYSIALIAVPFGVYIDSREGIHAGVVTWRRIEDNAIPARGKICGSYVNSALATDEAHRNGYDEAIFLNEAGRVVEGATCNIFIVKHGKLITPPPSDNILEGITRETVMELARRELHIETLERSIDRSELYQCDEAFFCGTAVELAPIIKVDHHPIGNGRIGPIASELRRIYSRVVHGLMEEYRFWRDPVCLGPAGAPEEENRRTTPSAVRS